MFGLSEDEDEHEHEHEHEFGCGRRPPYALRITLPSPLSRKAYFLLSELYEGKLFFRDRNGPERNGLLGVEPWRHHSKLEFTNPYKTNT